MSVPTFRPFPAARAALPVLAVLLLVVALAGCQRRPRFEPVSADSTAAATNDSLVEQVRVMQERWSAGSGEEAAGLTAAMLLQDLRARIAAEPETVWEERARELLDSLDVGAEVAGAPCALAVNFFSRSDPAAGSWPWLYWCGPDGLAAQAVEGQGMALTAVAARGLAAPGEEPPRVGLPGVAALLARRTGGGQQPLLMVWRAGARLELEQTLGPDSLGGVGTGAFEAAGDSGAALTVRTWRPTPRFDECSTCPHVVHERRLRWGLDGFRTVEDRVVPTPYVAFVRLVHALTAGDDAVAHALVTRPDLVESARAAGWAVVKGPWRAAPGTGAGADQMVFYRGSTEAWRVTFERQGDDWRVDSFAPTSRSIE